MLNKIKDNALSWFSISLIATYFGAIGYFNWFNIDISTYVTVSDLVLVFSKYTLILAIFVFMAWDIIIRIGKTLLGKFEALEQNVRRGILVVIVLATELGIYYFNLFTAISIGMFIGIFLIFAVLALWFSTSQLLNKKELEEIRFQNWLLFLVILTLWLAMVPFLVGTLTAKYSGRTEVLVVFEDGSCIDTRQRGDKRFIGELSNYLFIHDIKDSTSTVYPMVRVSSITIGQSQRANKGHTKY